MGLMKELNDLNNIYQNMYAEDENKGYVVTRADKKGNTPAWQGYKAGAKKIIADAEDYFTFKDLKDSCGLLVTTDEPWFDALDKLPSVDRAYIVAHQTSLEVIQGLWLRVSPQLHWTDRNSQSEIRRLVFGADVYPRTHWHVNLSYYRDRTPFFDSSSRTFLAQLHLYL